MIKDMMKTVSTAHITTKIALVVSIAFLLVYAVYWPETMTSYSANKISEQIKNNPTKDQLKDIVLYAKRVMEQTTQASVIIGRAVIGFTIFIIFSCVFCAYKIRKIKENINKKA